MDNLAGTGRSREELESAFLYITCGAFSVMLTWVLGQFRMTRDEVTDEVIKLTLGALDNFFKEE